MNSRIKLSAIAVATVAFVAPANAGWNVFKEAEKIGQGIGHRVEDVGQAAGQVIQGAGQGMGEATGIEVPEGIQQPIRDAGNALETAVSDTGNAGETAAGDTGHTLKKADRDAGDEVERFGDWLDEQGKKAEQWLCNTMTNGDYERGEAGCSVDAGVGHDDEGYYTYSPSEPERKYRGNEDPADQTPDEGQLSEFASYLNNAVEVDYASYGHDDWMGLVRFLPPDYLLGDPWPATEGMIMPPTKSGKVRLCCEGGGGGFLSPRKEPHGTVRLHGGVDYVTTVGETIYAPIDGWIVRPKNPSGDSPLTGILIQTPGGYTATLYYVALTSEIKAALKASPGSASGNGAGSALRVKAGETVIGHAQDIHVTYPEKVPMHVHMTLEDPSGRRVSPNGDAVIAPKPVKKAAGS